MPKINDSFNLTKPDFGKSPVDFLKEVKAELLKVNWPKKPEIIKLTGVVIGVTLLVGVYLGGLDFIFTKITELVVKK